MEGGLGRVYNWFELGISVKRRGVTLRFVIGHTSTECGVFQGLAFHGDCPTRFDLRLYVS